MSSAPTVALNNGLRMPALGLGTYASTGTEGVDAVRCAIDAGYRHFDTAYFYGNEAEVGRAINERIAAGAVRRDDVFFVTKLWPTDLRADRVRAACQRSLANCGLGYIDLYLIHFPVAIEPPPEGAGESQADLWPTEPRFDDDVDFVDTWREMERLVDAGLVRSIGVSNFSGEQIERLVRAARIRPVTNQVECSPALNQRELAAVCAKHNIVLTAYSPLGWPKPEAQTPAFMFGEPVQAMARKYGKTAAQIVLRYLHELGTVPIPKSVRPERIRQNIDIFDFELTAEERGQMEAYQTGVRLVKMTEVQKAKHYPFERV